MTRLMIGGVEIGLSKLLSSMESWDRELASSESTGIERVEAHEAADKVSEEESPPTEETSLLHDAIVGLFFETQDNLLKGIDLLDRTTLAAIRLTDPWLRPLQHNRAFRPLRRQVDRLAERGEKEVMRLVARGRQETEQSQKLVKTAISRTVEQNIENLTSNPEVQELVQKESTGLANEMLEEVRERTVSADNFLEDVARRLLHKPPRQELPTPPQIVVERAKGIRSHSGKRARLQ